VRLCACAPVRLCACAPVRLCAIGQSRFWFRRLGKLILPEKIHKLFIDKSKTAELRRQKAKPISKI
jgi:hypothetical protein